MWLSQVPLFASLPEQELRHLATLLRPIALRANTTLFREGEYGDRFYLITEGEVEVVKALNTLEERLIAVRVPGEYVGEMSLFLQNGVRAATVRARRDSQLLEMTRADFDALLLRQPHLAYELVRVLSARLRESDDAMIRDLQAKNELLTKAYRDLQAAHAQLLEKERLERELQVARSIQESILPRSIPQLDDFDVAAYSLPARIVGGDSYDIFSVGEGRVGLVIADACDKGVPAAIFMALTRSLIRAEASRAVSPSEALQNVNRHLLDMNETGMFVTAIYGILDLTAHTFRYARAGHTLPMFISREGLASMAPRTVGQPLGLWPQAIFDEHELTLPPGFSVLLYTDGISEASNEHGELFGIERLCDVFISRPIDSAQYLCDTVVQTVNSFCGNAPQSDDMTLLALHARVVE